MDELLWVLHCAAMFAQRLALFLIPKIKKQTHKIMKACSQEVHIRSSQSMNPKHEKTILRVIFLITLFSPEASWIVKTSDNRVR